MTKIRIEPYKTWSGGAKALGERCGILRATRRQVAKHGDFDYIINWGRNERRFRGEYLNDPERVREATDKLLSARKFQAAEVPSPDFTDDQSVAQGWYDEGHAVVCRTLLRANGGRGIVLASPENEQGIVRAPLYTKYEKKADEYRVHVFNGEVIDIQQKRRRLDTPDERVDFQIRNAANGWVFCRDNVVCPDPVRGAAVGAVNSLGLHFGAVDIGYNQHHNRAAVYEVNTAPGLEGTTLDRYYEALVKQFPAIRSGMYKKRREQ